MTLSISSFNKLLIISAIALVMSVQLIVFYVYPMPAAGIDYHWRNEINKEKPDIILIGSSPLRQDVDNDQLEGELQFLMHKKCKVLKLSERLTAAAYWQLILKNQVCPSQDKDYSVGLFVAENTLTSQEGILNNDGLRKEVIVQQLKSYDEPLHYRKGMPELKESPAQRLLRGWRFFYLRERIYSDLFIFFMGHIFHKIRPSLTAESILNKRFHEEAFDNPSHTHDIKDLGYDFDGSLNDSFLPDIVALKKDHNIDLFVVILPIILSKDDVINQAKKVYYSKLKAYLESNGVKYISFSDNKEFNATSFRDAVHLKNPAQLTKMLAQELVDKGIVR